MEINISNYALITILLIIIEDNKFHLVAFYFQTFNPAMILRQGISYYEFLIIFKTFQI